MAYTLTYSGGNGAINTFTVADGTLNISNTSLQLPGRNYAGYGSPVDQDLVWLTESFASFSGSNYAANANANYAGGPPNPLVGQMWFENVGSKTGNLTALQVAFPPTAGGNSVSWKQVLINDPTSIGTFGKIRSNTITSDITGADDPTVPGTLIGNWSLSPGSQLNLPMGGTANFIGSEVMANDISTGGSQIDGNIIGAWNVGNSSSITLGNTAYVDTRAGNLIANTINSTDANTPGGITGQWTLQPGSGFTLNQSNLFFSNTANGGTGTMSTVDLRTGSTDNFYANNISAGPGGASSSANLTGNWQITPSSNLIFGTSTILNITNANVIANNFTTGSATTPGTLTGNWTINTDLTVAGNLFNSNIVGNGGAYLRGGLWTIPNNLTVGGALTTTNITTGGQATVGTITGNWSLSGTSQLRATYADLAERFHADATYEAGTVLELGGVNEVTAVKDDASNNVFGVISTNAAYIMNGDAGSDDTHPIVALAGRVPVRVIGNIAKFDYLVSAGNGVARSANNGEVTPTNVIGRALEGKTGDGEGKVMTIVRINI